MQQELINSTNPQTPQTTRATTKAPQASKTNVSNIERWVSSIGGGALAMAGVRRGGLLGAALAAAGSGLAWRGISGHCAVYQAVGMDTADAAPQSRSFNVQQRVTINKSPAELYRFWRNFENLPQFMRHLESVATLDSTRSHWVAKAPAGTTVAWDAQIISEQENESIAWRSLSDADVDNSGSVRFIPGPQGRGTEVHVTIGYNPPAGALGAAVAKLFGEEPNQQVGEDLLRFKQLMEAGEVATTEGQSRGQRSALGKVLSPNN